MTPKTKTTKRETPLNISTLERTSHCEYCIEFHKVKESRFQKRYGFERVIRTHRRNNQIAIFPTLGQLTPHSLLLAPIVHIESMAKAPRELQLGVLDVLSEIFNHMATVSPVAYYEHGSTSHNGTGCGIFHAHIHITPIPDFVTLSGLMNENVFSSHNIIDAWNTLSHCDDYLLFGTSLTNTEYLPTNTCGKKISSQVLRKALKTHFNLNKPWDWRECQDDKNSLLSSTELIKSWV
ncbi:hypothetical protein [Planctopirus hydrillae]|uniref:hypothetical protein n=1 Tax=Planctopirus hydrillae TaxID=1841610 RepID=UPI0010423FDF|nr:hypothetical protein [Planctopirus hydrillae]